MNNCIETIKKELRGILRDKKSLLMMVVTPLLIPMFIFIFSYIYNEMIYQEEPTYVVGVNYVLDGIEESIIKEVHLEYKNYASKEEMEEAYNKKEISAYIVKENNQYTIYCNTMKEASSGAGMSITSYLESYNRYIAENYLASIEVDSSKVHSNVVYSVENITDGSNDLVDMIITFGFIFAIMSITLTAIYSATDVTAGEKERGTLETFLTFPIKSTELILGKYFAIAISCIVTSIISIVLAIGTFTICKEMFTIYEDVVFTFTWSRVSLVFSIMLAYSFFISGLCIAIASFSKTFKEAQSVLTPLSMFVMVPMFLDILEINMSPMLAMIPIVNHTLLINAIVCGNINIRYTAIMFVSTLLYVTLIIIYITKQYKSEKILFSN